MGSRTEEARFPVVLLSVASLVSNKALVSFLYLATYFLCNLEEHDTFALATLSNQLKLACRFRSCGKGRDETEDPPEQPEQFRK